MAAGGFFSMALDRRPSHPDLGLNDEGQLGDGTTMDRLTPVYASNVDGFAATAIGAGFTRPLLSRSALRFGTNENERRDENGTETEYRTCH